MIGGGPLTGCGVGIDRKAYPANVGESSIDMPRIMGSGRIRKPKEQFRSNFPEPYLRYLKM